MLKNTQFSFRVSISHTELIFKVLVRIYSYLLTKLRTEMPQKIVEKNLYF